MTDELNVLALKAVTEEALNAEDDMTEALAFDDDDDDEEVLEEEMF